MATTKRKAKVKNKQATFDLPPGATHGVFLCSGPDGHIHTAAYGGLDIARLWAFVNGAALQLQARNVAEAVVEATMRAAAGMAYETDETEPTQ